MDYHSALGIVLAISLQAVTVLSIVLLVFFCISFIVAGAEVAFFSLSYKDINLLKTRQQPAYKRVVALMEHPQKLLGNLLVANSFVNIAIIILSNLLLNEMIAFNGMPNWVELLIKIAAVTFLLVLFGEVMPKVMATQNNIRFAKDTSGIIEAICYLFNGVSTWLVKYSDIIEKKLASKKGNMSSIEELGQAIDIPNDSTEGEKNILKGILKFGNTTAKQVMKARLDVHGIDHNLSYNDLIKRVEELHYSRIPVYKEDLDNIAGVLHTKDLLPHINEAENFDWHTLIRPAYFVHEQKFIEDLLQEFRTKRMHFAVVVDEFGGTSGIVTLEDILEEIIGEIKDEFDEEDFGYKKLDDANYIFEGKTMINDVVRIMQLTPGIFDNMKGESDTVAGLVLEIAGEIPAAGNIVSGNNFEFTALEVENNRIKRIKITVKPQEEEDKE